MEVFQGLSVLIPSSVQCIGGTGQVSEGNWSYTRETLGEGLLRVERCCSSCLTLGEALAEGLGRYEGLEI